MAWKKRKYDEKYAQFRKAVRSRDCNQCRFPRCTESRWSNLCVHHIRCWEKYPTLRYTVSNGITLCKKHHKLVTGSEEAYAPIFLRIINGK